MINYTVLTRSEISTHYSRISHNEYICEGQGSDEELLDAFLNPEHFKHEDFHAAARHSKDAKANFLGHALNLEQIHLSDFKKMDKQQLLQFFNKPITESINPQTDREEQRLSEKFISLLKAAETEEFYLISKDFFDLNLDAERYFENYKLLYDALIYEPYYLLLWFDTLKLLHVCEYLSD
jgi:hypothetical protein